MIETEEMIETGIVIQIETEIKNIEMIDTEMNVVNHSIAVLVE